MLVGHKDGHVKRTEVLSRQVCEVLKTIIMLVGHCNSIYNLLTLLY